MSDKRLIIVTGEIESGVGDVAADIEHMARRADMPVARVHAGEFFRRLTARIIARMVAEGVVPHGLEAVVDAANMEVSQMENPDPPGTFPLEHDLVTELVSTISYTPSVQLASDVWWRRRERKRDITMADAVVLSGQNWRERLAGSNHPVPWLEVACFSDAPVSNDDIKQRRRIDRGREERPHADPDNGVLYVDNPALTVQGAWALAPAGAQLATIAFNTNLPQKVRTERIFGLVGYLLDI